MSNIQLTLSQHNRIQRDINSMEYIFGSNDSILNMTYLVIKHNIIKSRADSKKINANIILNEIYRRIIIEKRKTSPYKFERKWNEQIMLVQHVESIVLCL